MTRVTDHLSSTCYLEPFYFFFAILCHNSDDEFRDTTGVTYIVKVSQ